MQEHPVGDQVSVTRSEERLQVGTRRVVSGRVRLHRRVVTERLTVEVDVRREELVVEQTDEPDGVPAGAEATGSPYRTEPLVVVLREEVPDVRVRVRPYEQVQVSVLEVASSEQVTEQLRKEVVEVEQVGATGLSEGVGPAGDAGRSRL